jgi:hypothetical protein
MKAIRVHFEKQNTERKYWVNGNKIPEKINRMYHNPKP